VKKAWFGSGRLFEVSLFAGFLLLIGLIIGGLLARSDSGDGADSEVAAATAAEVVAPVSLTEFAIDGDLVVPPGEVTLDVRNDGAIQHNLVFEGRIRTAELNANDSEALALGTLAAGSYEILCDIPGHAEAGMKATLVVQEGSETPGEPATEEEPDWEALDTAMTESILAFPAETEGIGNQPLEPTILADGTKEFHLTTAITDWEVEPGKFVEAWTYNGQVPGPAIQIDVGDRIRVVVDNQLPMGTDIHWHGIRTPNDQDGVAPLTQPLIESGTEYVYEFEATRPAVGMYHAHHHGQMQVPNGLFGTLLIGDPPLPLGETISGFEIPADLELTDVIPMVLNDAGVIGFSLNGKSFPATEPYVYGEGSWIAVHYYNEGLQIHPMHQHQFPQLVFAKDGIPLDNPYWADTINVAPGERYSVLMHLDTPGVWVWHCHILNHVEREEGMFGMVTAIIVEPADGSAVVMTEDEHSDEAEHDEAEHDEAAGDGASDVVGDADRVVEVIADDFSFEPSSFEASIGETVTFRVTNVGAIEHEFRLSTVHGVEDHLAGAHEDHGDAEEEDPLVLVAPGETADLTVTFDEPTTFEIVACLLEGHYEAGMFAEFDVG